MSYSTGMSLLTAGSRSFLSYSTAAFTNSDWSGRVCTASPNPDMWGSTGFSNSPTAGMSATSGSTGVLTSVVGVYPNYILTVYPNPATDYLNSPMSTTITPEIKDSAGIIGETSGPISVVNLQRILQWSGDTSHTTSGAVDTESVIWGVNIAAEGGHDTGWVRANNTISSTHQRGNWVTIPAGTLGPHYEVKYVVNGAGGSASVNIASHSGSGVTNGLSENTYYPARTSSGGVSPVVRLTVPQGLSGVVDFTVTIRSIINPSMSISQNLLLTFNN